MKTLVIPVLVMLLAGGAGLSCRVESASQQTASQQTKKAAATQGEIDRLLAPVALYPDQLLAQILLCSSRPGKVFELSTWLADNKALKGSELQDAATVAGFEPSFVALALFPQVVNNMADKLDWVTRLGQVFDADKKGVFASIQRLRAQAQKAGALKDTPQQDVETRKTSDGQQVIVIEPANPQIVYVPQYDPQVVYVPTTQTVVVQEDDDDADAALAGLVGFTAGIAIGAAFDNDYYYGPYGWGGGFYMYNDAWDDWYDHREDAREDWADHREDLLEERGERRGETQEQRTERLENRQEGRTGSQEQRTERQQGRQETRTGSTAQRTERQQGRQQAGATPQARSAATVSDENRGYSSRNVDKTTLQQNGSLDRSGTRSDAFSGYSSGKSERAARSRGQRSRGGASRSGGGRRR